MVGFEEEADPLAATLVETMDVYTLAYARGEEVVVDESGDDAPVDKEE